LGVGPQGFGTGLGELKEGIPWVRKVVGYKQPKGIWEQRRFPGFFNRAQEGYCVNFKATLSRGSGHHFLTLLLPFFFLLGFLIIAFGHTLYLGHKFS